MEQLDCLRLEDGLASLRRGHAAAAHRLGIAELAHKLQIDPSTLTHQHQRDGNKRPSADDAFWCLLLDDEFLNLAAAVRGFKLSRPPDLTPEEGLREAVVRAQARGYLDARDLADLFARVKRGGQ